jgi:signal transduction histidine kinase
LDIQCQPVHVSRLLERVRFIYQPIAVRQQVELALDAPDPGVTIDVDEGRMLQVLNNLVENALPYTPCGGKITLSAVAGERVQIRVA